MDNIPMGLSESDNSSISGSFEESLSTPLLSLSSSKIFTTHFSSLDSVLFSSQLSLLHSVNVFS